MNCIYLKLKSSFNGFLQKINSSIVCFFLSPKLLNWSVIGANVNYIIVLN